jgi:hypothetical protein
MSAGKPEINAPLSVEELSNLMGVPRAFFRLALELGCPSVEGKLLSWPAFEEWLAKFYGDVCATVGISKPPAITATDPTEREMAEFKNELIVILEYCKLKARDDDRREILRRQLDSVRRWDVVGEMSREREAARQDFAEIRQNLRLRGDFDQSELPPG